MQIRHESRRIENIDHGPTGTAVLGPSPGGTHGWWSCGCIDCYLDVLRRLKDDWRQQTLDLDGER